MSPLSIITTYYNQQEMLKKQIELWESYCDNMTNCLNDNIKFIVVDDHSRIPPDKDMLKKSYLDISLYTITDNIFFNVPGAVNLGAFMAETPWILKQDMDTTISQESLRKLLDVLSEDKGNTIYKYYRTNGTKNSSPNKIAPGQFCIRKKDFWRIGGWDEDFCGKYGMNDPAFFFRAKQMGYNVEERKDIQVLIDEDGESDINRDVSLNKRLYNQKVNNKIPWSRKFLRFNWVCEDI